MKHIKIVTVVGTRPEIIRLSRLVPRLDEMFSHVFVHTGQNASPELSDVFFKDLNLRKPDYYLDVDTSSLGSVIGDLFRKVEKLFLAERPNAVVILGDTNSALSAILAERMNIPVYHLEAGNRSFDQNVPEELNRRIVDRASSFNLPYNNFSLRNLLNEGFHPRSLMKTGSPLGEVYEFQRRAIADSRILEELMLEPQKYLLASIHRQENVDNLGRLGKIVNSLEKVGRAMEMPVIMSTHPRTKKFLKELDLVTLQAIRFLDPFGYNDYNKLQQSSACVISDSGTIFEESTIMDFKAVCLRDSMERPEAFEAGSAYMSPVEADSLTEVVALAMKSDARARLPEGYEIMDFSTKVANFIGSTVNLRDKWLGINAK